MPRCLPSEFTAKAAELHRELSSPKDPKAAPVHPLVAKVVLAGPPSSMQVKWLIVTRRSSRSLKAAGTSKLRNRRRAPVAALPEPEWESLRKAIFGEGGPLAVNNDGMRFILDQGQRNRLEQLSAVIQQINATDPGSPPRAMVVSDCAEARGPARFHARQSGAAWAGHSPAVPQGALEQRAALPSSMEAAASSWHRRSRPRPTL